MSNKLPDSIADAKWTRRCFLCGLSTEEFYDAEPGRNPRRKPRVTFCGLHTHFCMDINAAYLKRGLNPPSQP